MGSGSAGADATLAIAGEVHRRDDARYEAERKASVWTLRKPARRPDMLVRARTVEDVVEVVRHARADGATIAVKGSGHNYAATFLRDEGIMLDVSALDDAQLDGTLARVQPGIRSGALARFLNERGRAFPGGHNANVGIGGFLLGGGMGFNGESWGQFSCFGVEAVEVVTAAGERLTVSADHHPDLFWAARGAGPGFPAVATRFHLATEPLPTAMRGGRYVYPLSAAEAVASWLQGLATDSRPNMEYFMAFEATTIDGRPADEIHCHARVLAFQYDQAEATAALEEAAAAAPAGALASSPSNPVTYERLYASGVTGAVLRIVSDTIWTEDGVAAATELARRIAHAPSRQSISFVNFRAAPRPLPDAAMSVAGSTFLNWAAQWPDAAGDAENERWVDATTAAMEPFRTGCYVNETDILRHPERARHCYTPDAWERMAAVRAAWDPDGLFPPAY